MPYTREEDSRILSTSEVWNADRSLCRVAAQVCDHFAHFTPKLLEPEIKAELEQMRQTFLQYDHWDEFTVRQAQEAMHRVADLLPRLWD